MGRVEQLDVAWVLMREVSVMALLIALGIVAKRIHIFTEETACRLSDFLLMIVLPVLLVQTFQGKKDPALMPGFWAAIGIAAVLFTLAPIIATLLMRRPKEDDEGRYLVNRLAIVMPNCGFMGIPLILATTGKEALIYVAGMIGVFQVSTWVWAIPMMEGRRPSLKRLIINPGILSFITGITLFLTGVRLPSIVSSFMTHIAALNTPLSMLMIGIFLADIHPLKALRTPAVYKIVFLRNLLMPLLAVLLLYLARLTDIFGKQFSLTIVILFSCACAASVLLLPLRVRGDSVWASQLVAASTLLSVFTLPFVAFIADKAL